MLPPTFHDQVIVPAELAVLSPSPAAVEGPDLYSTTIEQRAFTDVLIDTEAVLFRETEAVRAVTLTTSVVVAGFGVGLGDGFVVGFGVAFGFLVGAAPAGEGESSESVSAGEGVEPNAVAWTSGPKAAGGGVGAGFAGAPPRDDPTAAARTITTIATPTHERLLQPVFATEPRDGNTPGATGVATF
ncbi:MAG: hypothetical protein QOE66_15 [Chloroflexota bacterium]|nr:hypothetical protein [Chloroflexota bacterium]